MTKRVLVVEDDDGIREIIQISLESIAGWTVWTASSGKEGIAIAQAQPLDLILLDVVMPEEHGTVVFQKLQADRETRSIPTILLTAKAKASERQALMELGVDGIITKPFQAKILATTIKQILSWP